MDDSSAIMFLMGGLVGLLVCGFIGYAVGDTRKQGGLGFLLGFLLGPLGILVAVLLPKKEAPKAQRWQEKQARKYRAAPATDPVEEWEVRERAKRAFTAPPGTERPGDE
jgi:MFS family permease